MLRRALAVASASVAMATAGVLFAQAARAASGTGADWPCFRGPDHNGMSKETGINKNWRAKPPRELWRKSLGDGGYAGPSSADGKVFIIDHEGSRDVVRALDIKTGRDIWRFPYEDTAKANYGFARSTPTYDEGKLYTFSRLGMLHCLDARTGRKVWALDVVRRLGGRRPGWDYAGSVLVDGPVLVINLGASNGTAAALDKRTGKLLWRGGGGDKPGYATPVAATILRRKQYLFFTGGGAVGVDARSGRRLWGVGWKTRHDVNAATPIAIKDLVFITSGYKRGCAMIKVSASGARIAWENKEVQAQFNTPIYSGGHIYATSDPNRLVCLDPRSGRVVWQERGFGKGGMVGVDGTLIVMDGSKGDVAMVEMSPKRYRELGRIKPLGGQSWTAPIVAQGKLIVRNKSAIACLDLR